ncbi:MAG: hypothetical protein OES79_06885 [Planctomycetota bacterium]|nr:hypothetical protein [Planctomycetota bacterium]
MKRLIIAAIAVDIALSSICVALWLATARASFLTGLLCAQSLAIGTFVYFLAHKTYNEQREKMRQFAQQNGMQVIESTDDTGMIRDQGIITHLQNLDVFANRQAMVLSPLLQRGDNGTELAVFQLLYLHHATRKRVSRTAVVIRDPNLQLPAFAMRPKELDKRRSRRLPNDIDAESFEAHLFDGKLTADQLWKHQAAGYFREQENLYVEGGDDVVIVYKKRVGIDGWQDLVRTAFEVFEMLNSHTTMPLQMA